MNNKLFAGLFFACCGFTMCSSPLRAAMGEPLTLAEKVAVADIIVHARCIATTTSWRDGVVFTNSEYSVVDDLTGRGLTSLSLVVPGGTAVHPTLKVAVTTRLSDSVQVEANDEVILFARRNAAGEYRLVAGGQSYLRLVRDHEGLQRVQTEERRIEAKPAAPGQSARGSATASVTDIEVHTYVVDEFKAQIRRQLTQLVPAREQQ